MPDAQRSFNRGHELAMPALGGTPADSRHNPEADADTILADQEFRRGVRIIICGTPSGIRLTGQSGEVAGADPEWEGYSLIDLDSPAIDADTGERVTLIVEAAFNLRPATC